jgi:hypothetical protein
VRSGLVFDADGHLFRLASEASVSSLPTSSTRCSRWHLSHLEALPHQIQAVYGDMLH